MSIRLTVKQRSEAGGAEKPSVVLLDDDTVTLGRDQTCQVVLAQSAVSRNHARISRDGTLFFLEDLGSSYGTQINGHKLPKGEKHLLRNGDVIAIAQFDVTFDRVAQGSEESGKTMFVARKVVKDVMRGLAAGGEQPYFRIMNGKREGERFEVQDASEYVIGREEGVELLFPDDDLISRRHCKIRRDWSGTHVEDLGSRNGIKVNRKRTKKKTLKDRDELEVGGVRLLYIDPTEVREAPVVLPNDDDEATIAPGPDDEPAEDPKKSGEQPQAEEPPAPEPEPEPSQSQPDEEPAPDEAAAHAGPTPDEQPPPDNTANDNPAMTHPDGEPPEAAEGGFDLKSRQNLVFIAIAGVVALVAVVFLVLVLAM